MNIQKAVFKIVNLNPYELNANCPRTGLGIVTYIKEIYKAVTLNSGSKC